MKKKFCCVGIQIVLLCCFHFAWSQNVAPNLSATGNQIYCPGSSIKIVTNMTIVDPDDTGIDAVYVQISSGYDLGQDMLTLTGSHPNITTTWNSITGVLALTGTSGQPAYIDLVAAIKDIEYSSSSTNPSGIRDFSISVGQANYLPSNGHYYLFVPNIGIRWSSARTAAANTTYYGLQGYLATITSAEEAQIAGEQTTGAGWIGGSDEAVEGIWRWMTGPEAGTQFWSGNFTGFTNNYAYWNNGEPNDQGGSEDYAHVTAPGVGLTGSWNDLTDTGGSSGDYQPKGYIVEFGGMPGDPILHISASTTLTIPSISSTTNAIRCGSGTTTLQATINTGTINWYDVASGGTAIGTGTSFTTPNLMNTTTFYAAAHVPGCFDTIRVPVIATVKPKPVLNFTSPFYMCNETYTVIDIPINVGVLLWYDSPTSTSPIFSGPHFVVPNIHQDTPFYVEANFDNCISDRESFVVEVFPSPIVADETYILCEGDKITLNADNPGLTYLWSTGETTQTILSEGLTNYSVVITTLAPESCAKTKNFTITYNNQPVISTVDVLGLTITINTTQTGAFEYSIDGINYQDSNVFTVPEGGVYTAYVKEKNHCGEDQKPFIVISYSGFFTPNGDGVNDNWFIKGAINFSNAEVTIFDRFGKLITVLNSGNPSWDGKLNGKLLPATDYWFVAKIDDAFPETKGHFALKR